MLRDHPADDREPEPRRAVSRAARHGRRRPGTPRRRRAALLVRDAAARVARPRCGPRRRRVTRRRARRRRAPLLPHGVPSRLSSTRASSSGTPMTSRSPARRRPRGRTPCGGRRGRAWARTSSSTVPCRTASARPGGRRPVGPGQLAQVVDHPAHPVDGRRHPGERRRGVGEDAVLRAPRPWRATPASGERRSWLTKATTCRRRPPGRARAPARPRAVPGSPQLVDETPRARPSTGSGRPGVPRPPVARARPARPPGARRATNARPSSERESTAGRTERPRTRRATPASWAEMNMAPTLTQTASDHGHERDERRCHQGEDERDPAHPAHGERTEAPTTPSRPGSPTR